MERHSVSADRITLEVTENIAIYRVKELQQTLKALKDSGFTIALDDFGNGYFSFSNFISLPIDVIKLDRDFVSSLMTNQKHKPVIAAFITMAHHLGLMVIVDGVEDHQQYLDWSELGCDSIQGYFISKPLPHKQILTSIQEMEAKILDKR